MKKKYVVIGSSAAGISALATLKRLEPEAEVTCITENAGDSYNTCYLAAYLSGEKPLHELLLKLPEHIIWFKGKKATSIMPEEHLVVLADGQKIFYDRLLLALGTKARSNHSISQWCDAKKGIFQFHAFTDVNAIKKYIDNTSIVQAVVIGAGLTGLECADALHKLDIAVIVVEQADRILPHFLDYKAHDWLRKKIELLGVSFVLSATVADIKTSADNQHTVLLRSPFAGIDAQLIIFALGTNAESIVLKSLAPGSNTGIAVNHYLQTPYTAIFAAGDCALVADRLTGKLTRSSTWVDAIVQGAIAARNMVGLPIMYKGVIHMFISTFFGIPVAFCGVIEYGQNDLSVLNYSCSTTVYYVFFIDTQNRVKGCILMGDVSLLGPIKKAIEDRCSFDFIKAFF
jgi:nitrite reductase (NADH) large subunit